MASGQLKYVETDIVTASPARLVLVLYEAGIENILKAKKCIQAGDICGKGEHIGKAIDILSELNKSLNMEKGKDLARNLESLYRYCVECMVSASIKIETAQLDNALNVLCTLREGWETVLSKEASHAGV